MAGGGYQCDTLDILVQTHRNARVATRFLARLIARFGRPRLVIPQLIFAQTGAIRSSSPYPPMRGSIQFWDAVYDLINYHFGWQSPLTAQKTIQIHGPDWLEKEYANAIRLGIEITPYIPPFAHLGAAQKHRCAQR